LAVAKLNSLFSILDFRLVTLGIRKGAAVSIMNYWVIRRDPGDE
jgi:hypothetical protein